jgi:hypothetical protein
MQIAANGKVFKFEIANISRGRWTFSVATVDGDPYYERPDDTYPNERECRQAARRFASKAKYTRGLGWHS